LNDYVATAAAEKRLREVLAARLGRDYDIDEIADALLADTKIEYKARAKQVGITLDLPDKATPKADPTPDTGSSVEPDFEPGGNVQGPPQPHIVPFAPVLDPERDYEDVHYD
jgi:hypothetical protein